VALDRPTYEGEPPEGWAWSEADAWQLALPRPGYGLGIAGNARNYYDATNSLLPFVLVWRRGIPISLAQLHAAVGRRAGLPVQPVAVPMVRARPWRLQLCVIGSKVLGERLCPCVLPQHGACAPAAAAGLRDWERGAGGEALAGVLAQPKQLQVPKSGVRRWGRRVHVCEERGAPLVYLLLGSATEPGVCTGAVRGSLAGR
jgi:hypothetical protein